MVNNELNARLLEFLLRTEFEKRNIMVDFEYGIYDCTHEKIIYGNYVPLKSKQKNISNSLPQWSTHGYYFGVQFPNREAHIINQMGIWSHPLYCCW
jgi:two-component system phosphate regulon sensor histidine kinase PhoR